ncbi:transposase, partial [Streptomyces sp. NPDC001893]|uniref:transposase n=1 Tax=Streptomyces sp. NPDC001893 TaxID=3154530 RepID=UPI0033347877
DAEALRRDHPGDVRGLRAELKQLNDEEGHVHRLAHYPPKAQLSKLVNSASSRRLRQEYDAHIRSHLRGRHFWSDPYFTGSCGGRP